MIHGSTGVQNVICCLRITHFKFESICAFLESVEFRKGTQMHANFDPARPDGENQSLSLAISDDGTPEIDKIYTVAARCGVAVRVQQGQLLTVENTHGTQVCDFWAFSAANIEEHLSMEHLHTSLDSIFPKVGDQLVTNCRRPLFTIVEDTSPGVHDTVVASCDHHRYQQLGCTEYHDNCTDNLRMALIAIGLRAPAIPSPFNLWMNIPVAGDGSIRWLPTVSNPGDRMVFRTEMDAIAVMSACPQDITPINGDDCNPVELNFWVEAE